MTTAAMTRPLSFVGAPVGAWTFGIRIWLAVVVALAASFWLEIACGLPSGVVSGSPAGKDQLLPIPLYPGAYGNVDAEGRLAESGWQLWSDASPRGRGMLWPWEDGGMRCFSP
jgi:hypothetical protein